MTARLRRRVPTSTEAGHSRAEGFVTVPACQTPRFNPQLEQVACHAIRAPEADVADFQGRNANFATRAQPKGPGRPLERPMQATRRTARRCRAVRHLQRVRLVWVREEQA